MSFFHIPLHRETILKDLHYVLVVCISEVISNPAELTFFSLCLSGLMLILTKQKVVLGKFIDNHSA